MLSVLNPIVVFLAFWGACALLIPRYERSKTVQLAAVICLVSTTFVILAFLFWGAADLASDAVTYYTYH